MEASHVTPPNSQCLSSPAVHQLKEDIESELQCTVCFELLYAPIVTPCGHAFCRHCLTEALDRQSSCPLCRAVCHLDVDSHPECLVLTNVIRRALPDKFQARKEQIARERRANTGLTNIALFVSNHVHFPGSPLSLHMFEPRYLKMVKECAEGSRAFGVVLVKPDGELDDIGTAVQIQAIQVALLGRYNIQTIGRRRFRILRAWEDADAYGLWRATVEYFEDEQPQNEPEAVQLSHASVTASGTASGTANGTANGTARGILSQASDLSDDASSGDSASSAMTGDSASSAAATGGGGTPLSAPQAATTRVLMEEARQAWVSYLDTRAVTFRAQCLQRCGEEPPCTPPHASQWSLWLAMAMPISPLEKQACLTMTSPRARLMALLAMAEALGGRPRARGG
eukprot:CAMPEP_0118934144 /NCGR_PEP_ID=MMETSP1169-20130426/13661_1 /TAXON_ID=36882 /ORGANISM="Pyramimonas obovata, Strain CCMP722" /LENGTH=397 /DNA_ID=CAMNT_0006877015 /DNA_START=514 /DNA_END=1703 /DNA_ORIENTATION=-